MSQTTFQSLFRAKEFATLSGRRRRNLAVLSIVTLLTFLSVGFALGGLNYLAEKLNDPFVRQLSFQANQKITGVSNTEAIETVQRWSEKYDFAKKNVRMYGPTYNGFYNNENKTLGRIRGRGMSNDNPVLKDLCESTNIVWQSPKGDLVQNMDDANIRIIVTEDMIVKHGYDPTRPPSYLRIARPGSEAWQIPVLAVVKRLPDRSSYILSHNAWLALEGSNGTIQREPGNALFLHFEDVSGKADQEAIEQELSKEASKAQVSIKSYTWKNGTMNTERSRWTTRKENVLELRLQRKDTSNFHLAYKLDNFLRRRNGTALFAWGSKDGTRIPNSNGAQFYRDMSIYFNGLDLVSPFEEELTQRFEKVEVNLSSIENKKSLRLFSRLAYILAIFLISFSILSITTFVNSLISAHFQRIQRNLGTLKAFGLSTKILMRAYARISLVFVIISTIVGYVLAVGIGMAGTMRILITVAGLNPPPGQLYFDLFNTESALTIAVIIIMSYVFVRINLSRLLKYTPGELIYDRV